MSDALCGPSNALQNFQKHTSVDRTLQQDRLLSRQSPSQVSLTDCMRVVRHANMMVLFFCSYRASDPKMRMKAPLIRNSPRSNRMSRERHSQIYSIPPILSLMHHTMGCPVRGRAPVGRGISSDYKYRDLLIQCINNPGHPPLRYQPPRNKAGRPSS